MDSNSTESYELCYTNVQFSNINGFFVILIPIKGKPFRSILVKLVG